MSGSCAGRGFGPGAWPGPGERLATHASHAAVAALKRADLAADQVDLVLVATTTPDEVMPNAAPAVAHQIGATRAGAFDIGAACSGFLSALAVGAGQIESGTGPDRCGDRRRLHVADHRPPGSLHGSGVRRRRRRRRPPGHRAGQPDRPDRARRGRSRRGPHHRSAGRGCHPDARARNLPRGCGAAVAGHRCRPCARPARASRTSTCSSTTRPTAGSSARWGNGSACPPTASWIASRSTANTSAATLPLALEYVQREGRLRPGQKVLLGAFGAGFTWGATVVEWDSPIPAA